MTSAQSALDALMARIEETLGADGLSGAYLYGSLASGDYIEGTSDLDVLAVLARPLERETLARVGQMHIAFEEDFPVWRDRIEVQYVPKDALQRFKSEEMAIAVISPGEPFHAIRAGIDWTQNWYDIQENGRALRGPGPATFIPRITTDEFVASIRTYVAEHEQRALTMPVRRGTQAYAILTMCRAAFTCETGRQISKGAAAAWARSEMPAHASLIDWARAVRAGPRSDQYIEDVTTREQARAFVHEVAAQILSEPARHFEDVSSP